jgi:hypothetical protein
MMEAVSNCYDLTVLDLLPEAINRVRQIKLYNGKTVGFSSKGKSIEFFHSITEVCNRSIKSKLLENFIFN